MACSLHAEGEWIEYFQLQMVFDVGWLVPFVITYFLFSIGASPLAGVLPMVVGAPGLLDACHSIPDGFRGDGGSANAGAESSPCR